jgi:hypothetical protein
MNAKYAGKKLIRRITMGEIYDYCNLLMHKYHINNPYSALKMEMEAEAKTEKYLQEQGVEESDISSRWESYSTEEQQMILEWENAFLPPVDEFFISASYNQIDKFD